MANSERAFSLAQAVRQAVGDKPLEITGQVVQIPRDQITPNEANFYAMDEKGLESLATSIELTGLIHPIIVRPAEGGGYVITDGERRYRATGILGWPTVPAIVRTPINTVLEELALIEANRQARKLTDAEISKQAERLQELLVALKESGVEIPGRIRTAVSEAMQVSESKLARLKRIRAGLAPKFLEMFDAGEMNESAAYELSQAPIERQPLILPTPAVAKKLAGYEIRDRVRYAEDCMAKRACPYGGECSHGERQFTSKRSKDYSGQCGHYDRGLCCKTCNKRFTCDTICDPALDDVALDRQKAAQEEQAAKDKAQHEHDDRAAVARGSWGRLAGLRIAAGIPLDSPKLSAIFSSYKNYETGDVAEWAQTRGVTDALGIGQLASLADLFGVSLDALVGHETPQAAAGGLALAWHLTADAPPEAGRPVIFWGSRGLRTPPGIAIPRYITMWPNEYAWWAYVSPPPSVELQPAGAYADADGLAPASEGPDKAPEINPTPSPVLEPGA